VTFFLLSFSFLIQVPQKGLVQRHFTMGKVEKSSYRAVRFAVEIGRKEGKGTKADRKSREKKKKSRKLQRLF
jgi:hypothetical protein